jgi:hypothetical protein
MCACCCTLSGLSAVSLFTGRQISKDGRIPYGLSRPEETRRNEQPSHAAGQPTGMNSRTTSLQGNRGVANQRGGSTTQIQPYQLGINNAEAQRADRGAQLPILLEHPPGFGVNRQLPAPGDLIVPVERIKPLKSTPEIATKAGRPPLGGRQLPPTGANVAGPSYTPSPEPSTLPLPRLEWRNLLRLEWREQAKDEGPEPPWADPA